MGYGANVKPFSDNLADEIRQNHPKNLKLQKAINEIAICIQKMNEKIATVVEKEPEASSEKRCLRSTYNGKQNCTTVQMPVDILDKELHSMQTQTRNSKTAKKQKRIATELHFTSKPAEKKHHLRSTCTVSDSKSEQPLKGHHKVSEDENPKRKQARKSKEIILSPIATRTRTRIALSKQDHDK